MSVPALNLATRPFRNERLPALLVALGFTIAAAITVKHAMTVRNLLPGRTSGLASEVNALEAERSRLRAETASLRAPRPEPTAVAEWTMLKDLVDKRTFSWSGLFAVLEDALPAGVRLVSISPEIEKGNMTLELTAVARSNEDALEMIRVLEERPEFSDVLPRTRSGSDSESTEFRYSMQYTPRPQPPPSPAAAAAPSEPGPQPSPAAPSAAVSPAPPPAATPPSQLRGDE